MFELFDHTADLGLRVEAESLTDLLAEAGAGLLAVLVANPQAVEPRQSVPIELPRGEADLLMFDWLSELLFLFETESWLLGRFEITLTDDLLRAAAWGEHVGPQHQLAHEVKAVTYHQLEVAQVDGRWEATIIVDI